METIIVALIGFMGTLVGSYGGMRLMAYRLGELEKRVNEHNGVIRRTYLLEQKFDYLDERVRKIEGEN